MVAVKSPTWIVLARDVSDSVTIRGQHRTVLAAVLDADTGLMVASLPGTSVEDVLKRVLKAALVRPAAPLTKAVPSRLVAAPEVVQVVRAAADGLSWLVDTVIEAGVGMDDAEEILDGLAGHLEGRDQPVEPPTVEDWRLLYRELTAFTEAAPWQRWSDTDWFTGRFTLDGATVERDCLVLGNAGLQHGFNAVPDAETVRLASTSHSDNPLEHLDAALIVHLDPWRETHGVNAEKARRYGWPSEARLVPSLLTVRHGQPADLSASDARLLSLALHAVLTQDARRLVVADQNAVIDGAFTFADGTVGRFEIGRP